MPRHESRTALGSDVQRGVSLPVISLHDHPARDEDAGGTLPPLGRDLRVLLVWPKFGSSFWSMSGIMELLPQECFHVGSPGTELEFAL